MTFSPADAMTHADRMELRRREAVRRAVLARSRAKREWERRRQEGALHGFGCAAQMESTSVPGIKMHVTEWVKDEAGNLTRWIYAE